jgi:transcription elongation factor GreA
MQEVYLTRLGRKKLMDKLSELQKKKSIIQDELAQAIELGDLKENFEYHASKETLTNLMDRISKIVYKLSCSKIIEEQNISLDKVFIGVTVEIRSDGNNYKYTIVDSEEANPTENKISVQSPLVQGLLGHKVNDVVEVKLPIGKKKIKILGISR